MLFILTQKAAKAILNSHVERLYTSSTIQGIEDKLQLQILLKQSQNLNCRCISYYSVKKYFLT